jgi:hypothetical protein
MGKISPIGLTHAPVHFVQPIGRRRVRGGVGGGREVKVDNDNNINREGCILYSVYPCLVRCGHGSRWRNYQMKSRLNFLEYRHGQPDARVDFNLMFTDDLRI